MFRSMQTDQMQTDGRGRDEPHPPALRWVRKPTGAAGALRSPSTALRGVTATGADGAAPCALRTRLRGGNEPAPTRCCLRSGRVVPLVTTRIPVVPTHFSQRLVHHARMARGWYDGGGHAMVRGGAGVSYVNPILFRQSHRVPCIPRACQPLDAPCRQAARSLCAQARSSSLPPAPFPQAPHCPSLRDAVVRHSTCVPHHRTTTTTPQPTAQAPEHSNA